jgi:hypothetical protein
MAPKKSAKKLQGKEWTERQKKLIKYIPTSKTHAEAAMKAGFPAKNARQSAYQALRQMRGRVPDLMDKLGLSEEHLIDKHLRRLLRAKRVQFFQKDGEVTDVRETEALEIQAKAVDMAFQLHGSYAPRDPKEAAQYGVKIIIADIPGPPGEFNQFIDMVPPKHPKNYGNYGGGNGNKPKE